MPVINNVIIMHKFLTVAAALLVTTSFAAHATAHMPTTADRLAPTLPHTTQAQAQPSVARLACTMRGTGVTAMMGMSTLLLTPSCRTAPHPAAPERQADRRTRPHEASLREALGGALDWGLLGLGIDETFAPAGLTPPNRMFDVNPASNPGTAIAREPEHLHRDQAAALPG